MAPFRIGEFESFVGETDEERLGFEFVPNEFLSSFVAKYLEKDHLLLFRLSWQFVALGRFLI